MSEFHSVKVEYKDEKCLIESIREMGYRPNIHEKAISLHGYQGDERSQKAHIVIPRSQVGSASNDIGFERKDYGYDCHISEYDKNSRTFDNNKLKQVYTEKTLSKNILSDGSMYIHSRSVQKDGTIKLMLHSL